MQFGIHIGPCRDYSDPHTLASLAREAEEAGWHGFFIWDHIAFGGEPLADPWVALAAIAMSTRSMRIGTIVTPLARRRPWKVARETITLDHLSGGRLTLGVGLGDQPDEFEGLGEPADLRVRAAMLDEGLDVLAGLWSGQPFTYEGEHYKVKEALFRPAPVQSLRIPVWVAGFWPRKGPFRRAARWYGVFPGKLGLPGDALMPLDDLRAIAAYIKEQRTSDAPFDFVLGGATSGDDPDALAATFAAYEQAGLTWWLESIHPWRGPFEKMRARIHQGPPRA